jgi:co-chaperonin GroES (HSP10)
MTDMKLRPIYDHVLVEVEREWNQEIKGKHGIVGVTFENEIERGLGAIRTGKVVATPRGLSDSHAVLGIQDTFEVGDKVYFHFNSIDADSRMETDIEKKPNYLVHCGSIFCIVRNGKIIMYASRVLAEPIFDDDVVEDGGIRVKKTKSGIITEINVGHNTKKARLSYIGNPLAHQSPVDVAPGEVIYYTRDADFENEIEGKIYFCMLQEDLLAKEI